MPIEFESRLKNGPPSSMVTGTINHEKKKIQNPDDYSPDTIMTIYRHMVIRFPKGVFIQDLTDCYPKEKLLQEIPPRVVELMERKNCMEVYRTFAKECMEKGHWKIQGWLPHPYIAKVVREHRIEFLQHGINLYICEYIEGAKHHRGKSQQIWLEFVDLDLVASRHGQQGSKCWTVEMAKSLYLPYKTTTEMEDVGYLCYCYNQDKSCECSCVIQ